jgi:hypothetical protein
MKKTLDPRPARQLTSRECAKILGGVIGGLIDTAKPEDVRAAVRWWAETDEAWEAFSIAHRLVENIGEL